MNLYFIGRGIVLKGIVKYYGSGKNIPRTFGHTVFNHPTSAFDPVLHLRVRAIEVRVGVTAQVGIL